MRTAGSSLRVFSPCSGPCRAVTDSINQLITMCTQQAPGQKECDNALRELEVRTTAPLRLVST